MNNHGRALPRLVHLQTKRHTTTAGIDCPGRPGTKVPVRQDTGCVIRRAQSNRGGIGGGARQQTSILADPLAHLRCRLISRNLMRGSYLIS